MAQDSVEWYDRIARFFDDEYAGYDDELMCLQGYAKRTGGPILELGCGTGRLLIPLALGGHRVTGVDLSSGMLRLARAKAQDAGIVDRVTLVQGDYGSAELAETYGLAFVVMNGFLHLLTLESQLRALKHWRRHMKARGLLVVEVINPDVGQLAALDGRLEWDRTWIDSRTSKTVIKTIARTVDPAEQTLHVSAIYDELGADGLVQRTLVAYDLRYVWRYEAGLLLDKAGFDLETIYGDWDMRPFDAESQRMILVARRRAENGRSSPMTD